MATLGRRNERRKPRALSFDGVLRNFHTSTLIEFDAHNVGSILARAVSNVGFEIPVAVREGEQGPDANGAVRFQARAGFRQVAQTRGFVNVRSGGILPTKLDTGVLGNAKRETAIVHAACHIGLARHVLRR